MRGSEQRRIPERHSGFRSPMFLSEGNSAACEVTGEARERPGTVFGNQHAVRDAVASVTRNINTGFVRDDHANLQRGHITVLQPRRLVHPEPDPVTLSVAKKPAQPRVTDDIEAVTVGAATLPARIDRATADLLGWAHGVVIAALFEAGLPQHERALPLDKPTADGTAQ